MVIELPHGNALIPFTIAWLIGIWLASRVVLPTLALGLAMGVAIVGIVLTWRAPKPRWMFILALAAGSWCVPLQLCSATL